jgi:pyranose oxidase
MASAAGGQSSKGRVFIAGAGLAGCTFARILVDSGYDVIMADCGGQHSRLPGENLKNFHNYQADVDQFGAVVRGLMHPVSIPPHKGAAYTRNALNPRQREDRNLPGAVVAYAIGGMAVHWTCAIPRQHETERAGFIDDQEWDRLYTEAERMMNINRDVRSGSVRHQVLKAFLEEQGEPVRETPLAAERRTAEFVYHTGADTILGELAEPGASSRLSLLAEHRVSHLERQGGRVMSARVRNLRTGEDSNIEADIYVAAAGWLHSAQILWNSHIMRDEDSALGRYLHDHLFTGCQVVLGPEILKRIGQISGGGSSGPDELPIPMEDPAPHLYLPVDHGRPWHGMMFREAFQFDQFAPDVDDRLIVDFKWFGMIDTVRTNRVTFEPDIFDRFGMPQPTFDFQLGAEDKDRLEKMMADMQRVAKMIGGYAPKGDPMYVPLGASTHTMGATRMGPANDGTSVVNPNSQVWDFDNLYVAGNNVLPTPNACNPTPTSLALAIKAARHIVGRS